MVLIIKKLVIRERNVRHFAKHFVSEEEVREVFNKWHFVEGSKMQDIPEKRWIVIGETDDGRILEVPLRGLGNGKYFPLTAYEPGTTNRKKYLDAKPNM